MDLYKEILLHLLQQQDVKVEVTFLGLNFSAKELVELAAYCAMAQIQKILKDDTLTIKSAFTKLRRSSVNLNGSAAAADADMISDKKSAPFGADFSVSG